MGQSERFDHEDEAKNIMHLTVPQTELLYCDYKFPLFVAGFGSGKSQGLCAAALRDLFHFQGANIAVYAPTYDLLKLIIMGYIEEMLSDGGYEFTLNSSSHIFDVRGYGNIICRSMDNPARIVGYETFRAHCDEFDILPEDKARLAWTKIIARNRQKIYKLESFGKKNKKTRRVPLLDSNGDFVMKNGRQQFESELNRVTAYTTPEGFGFVYKRWKKEDDPKGHYGIIKASTHSNAHNLPEDYIDTLTSSYPAELIDAYINGEFVNLKSGRVYKGFDRVLNSTRQEVRSKERLLVGMDFNIEHGAATIHVLRNGKQELHCVDEIFNSYDTDQTIAILQERYEENPITVYPDATGKKRSSSNGSPTSTDLAKLKSAGFNVEVDYSNPLIRDRINCCNALICNGKQERRYFVNVKNCPNTVETLEQQVWDDNGVPDKKSGLDHIGDAFGYCITKMFPIVRTNAAFLKVQRRK